MRKTILLIVIFSMIMSVFSYASPQGMSTYENLCALDDDFIVRCKGVGVTDEQLELFLDDMDAVVAAFQTPIYTQDLDTYFITVMLQVMQKEEHIPILIAFDMAFQEEITYMLTYRMVPECMSNFKRIMFNEKLIFELEEDIFGVVTEEPEPEPVPEPEPEPEIILPFDDIKEYDWAVESIVYLYENGVVKGTGEKKFSPEKPITREEFLKMIVEALLRTNSMFNAEFGQRAEGKWYHSYLAAAEFYALIQGIYDENEFGDGVYITRQDMCSIAYRAALRADISLPKLKYSTEFYDKNQFVYYATEPITKLQEADIIHGKGNSMFEPNATTSRAEAAKIIHKLMLYKN